MPERRISEDEVMEKGLMILLARAFARESGIEIRTGVEPATDCKKTIWMPPISPHDKDANAIALRWLLHETAHINYTTPEVFGEAGDCRDTLNALEDVRIEHEKMKELPGAASRLSEGILALKAKGRVGVKDADTPAVVMHKFLLYQLRAELLGQPLEEEGRQAKKKLASLIGKDKAQKIHDIGRTVLQCSSTKEVLELARQIADILRADSHRKTGEDGQGSGGGRQKMPMQGIGTGDASEKDQKENPRGPQDAGGPQDTGKPEPADGEEPDAETAQENASAILQGMSKEEQTQASLEEAAKQEISHAASKLSGSSVPGSAMPGEGEYDVPKSGDGSSLIKRARDVSARLREVFETVIQTETLSHRYHVCRGRRLDTRRLSRLYVGDSRVFLQKTEGRKIDTAIHLAVDISGSMKGRPLNVAKEAAMAVALALEGMQNVNFSMLAFGSYLYPLKTWGEGLHTAASNLAGVCDGGGTALPEAIMDGLDKLLMVNRPQKILLVATDGQVEGFFAGTQDVIRRAREMGILCYGIGICTDVRLLFGAEYSIKIPSVEELPQRMFMLLQNSVFLREAA